MPAPGTAILLPRDTPPMAAPPSWLIELDETASTNSWALDHVQALADGACVWTRRQSAGRGRHGRPWYAPRGVLTASFLLRGPAAADAARLAACAALAVAHAVEDCCPGLRVGIKWPNDGILRDGKLAGILCERTRTGPPGSAALVVGIGLNLDPRWEEHLPAQALRRGRLLTPISLADVGAPVPDMITMLLALRRYLLEAHAMLGAGSWPQLRAQLRERDWLLDRELELLRPGVPPEPGRGAGWDDDGRLLVRTAQGLAASGDGVRVRVVGAALAEEGLV
jgi:BirA family biotin operon repressor/biotin-[acetyl-CoA-carboxylase] ligase